MARAKAKAIDKRLAGSTTFTGDSIEDVIKIRGARQHNLKNIDLALPRNQLVVFTGVSGSGKSSLAFDTIFAEGQRRYVESLSAYARQFLGQVDKPDVDAIEGLSPAISIDQKSTSHNPRSTVGTVTEIQDYLRLLFGRAGEPHCPQCERHIRPQTIDEMVDQILTLPEGTRYQLLAPVVRGKKGTHSKLLRGLAAEGFARVRINQEVRELSDNIELDKNHSHTIEVVVDRLVARESVQERLTDSLRTALKRGDGLASVEVVPKSNEELPEGIVHFIKIDTEGKDLDIVKSLSADTLKRTKFVCIECPNFISRFEGEANKQECVDYFESKNFKVFNFINYEEDLTNRQPMSDVVFINGEDV